MAYAEIDGQTCWWKLSDVLTDDSCQIGQGNMLLKADCSVQKGDVFKMDKLNNIDYPNVKISTIKNDKIYYLNFGDFDTLSECEILEKD